AVVLSVCVLSKEENMIMPVRCCLHDHTERYSVCALINSKYTVRISGRIIFRKLKRSVQISKRKQHETGIRTSCRGHWFIFGQQDRLFTKRGEFKNDKTTYYG